MIVFLVLSGIGSFFTFFITAIIIIAAIGEGQEDD